MDDRPLTVLLDGDPAAPQQARLGAALAARGMAVVVLDAPKVAAQIRDEFGQSCQEIRGLPRWTKGLRRIQVQAQARKLGVDVVHLNFLLPKQRLWADTPGGPPYIATVWGSDLNREVFVRTPEHEATLDHILRHASAVTSDAWPLLRKVEQRIGTAGPPRHLVLWSADLAAFDRAKHTATIDQLRTQMGIAPDQKVLLSPRQPQPHYHIERIVAGFAASQWAQQGVLVLKLHGKAGEQAYVEGLLRQASELGVRDQVLLAPRVPYDQLPALYALADAAVSLPEADGVPSTFLELMALRVPIVATDLPGYEGVLDPDRAVLVKPGDAPDLVAGLNRVLVQPAERATRAHTWARQHADWDKAVDQWVGLYRGAVAGR